MKRKFKPPSLATRLREFANSADSLQSALRTAPLPQDQLDVQYIFDLMGHLAVIARRADHTSSIFSQKGNQE